MATERVEERDALRAQLAHAKSGRDAALRAIAVKEQKERASVRSKYDKEREKVWRDWRKRASEIRETSAKAARSGIVVASEVPS